MFDEKNETTDSVRKCRETVRARISVIYSIRRVVYDDIRNRTRRCIPPAVDGHNTHDTHNIMPYNILLLLSCCTRDVRVKSARRPFIHRKCTRRSSPPTSRNKYRCYIRARWPTVSMYEYAPRSRNKETERENRPETSFSRRRGNRTLLLLTKREGGTFQWFFFYLY